MSQTCGLQENVSLKLILPVSFYFFNCTYLKHLFRLRLTLAFCWTARQRAATAPPLGFETLKYDRETPVAPEVTTAADGLPHRHPLYPSSASLQTACSKSPRGIPEPVPAAAESRGDLVARLRHLLAPGHSGPTSCPSTSGSGFWFTGTQLWAAAPGMCAR